MPIGRAKTQTNGTSNPTASATTAKRTWPLINKGRISLSTFPSNRTNVKTATVKSNDATTCRVK